MAPRLKTPQGVARALTGNASPDKTLDLIASHWGEDLVAKYARLSADPFCRWNVIRQLYRNSAVAQIVVASIADTIASLDWNIVPTDPSNEYWKSMSRISRNELMQSTGRTGGWQQFVQEFVEDLLINPTGHFTQIVYDGNGMPYQIGGIGEKQPRPYYMRGNEIIWDYDIMLAKREVHLVSGIYWTDQLIYRLPVDYYYQTVDSGRGGGGFLIGHSKAEKSRTRIGLSAVLEEYLQRVASGTDTSGVLVMNNLAYAALAGQMKKRKAARKQPEMSTDDQGSMLYVYNVGEKPGDAKWVSFRPFPEGMDIISLLGLAEDMVAAGFGVKTWRVDPSGSSEGGKFGNAKKAVQLDAQEPGVQWVMSMLRNMINNVFFGKMPLWFQWASGVNAADAIKLDNATKISQTVTQTAGWLKVDEMRRLAIDLGMPRRVMNDDTGVASSVEGITKTAGDPLASLIQRADEMFDEYGLDEAKFDALEQALNSILTSEFVAKTDRPIGSPAWYADLGAYRKDAHAWVREFRGETGALGLQFATGAIDRDRLRLGFARKALEFKEKRGV